MSLADLATYGMSAERGFLCEFDAESVKLSVEYAAVCDVAMRLPEILPTGAVRSVPDTLPLISPESVATLDDAQARVEKVVDALGFEARTR